MAFINLNPRQNSASPTSSSWAKLALALVFIFLFGKEAASQQCSPGETVTVTYSANGSGTFVIPAGVTSIRIQVWGAGGRGGTQSSDGEGGGGGGGAYSESTVTVIPGASYFYTVGRGSNSEAAGGDSWFSSSSNVSNAIVLAKGGASVQNNDDNGADGGNRNQGIGSIRYSGGDGGDGDDNNGGGGGSSASPAGDGEDGNDGDDGSDGGQVDSNGGDGGNGQRSDDGDGSAGQNPGGGGGGATRDDRSGTLTGGTGGDGQVILSYLCPSCGPTIAYAASIQQFTVPAGVTSISVEAWGGGGKGGKRHDNNGGTGGGGAGAYSSSSITVTPGETLYFKTGTGSTSSSNPGEDSWISRNANGSNPLVLAKGGSSVLGNNNNSGATGGRANQGIGTITTNGQDGEDGISSGNSSNFRGGAGGDSPNGGIGGQRVTSGNTAGNSGEFPGGGGSGARTSPNNITRDGGSGGNGLVKIGYDCASSNPSGCWRYIDDGSVSGTVIIEFFEDCTWEAPEGLLEFEVLVVGGGGGGGANAGGGGGAGGLIHARADVSELETYGLPANSLFEITIGDGGTGSDDEDEQGADGTETSFDNGGIYEIVASGGGGGGSADNEKGRNGKNSTYRNSTKGFSIVEGRNFGSSGGGAGDDGGNSDRGQGGENGKRGGRGQNNAGGGGGGASQDGRDADNDEGGNGGAGIIVSEFDARIYAAGGGGGAQDERGLGGENLRGGNGGEDNDENGEDGQTPGSGGGGSGDRNTLRGGNGAKGVVIVRYEIARILPVEYLYFNAKYNPTGRFGELTWATAKEWENDRFEVERSVNGVTSWEKVGEVAGAGYSGGPESYSFQDSKLPIGGGNIFYRLKQVDFDGDHAYSDTKSIKVEAISGSSNWAVFPNPTSGNNFNIKVLDSSSLRDEAISIRMIAPTGTFEVIQVSELRRLGQEASNYFNQKPNGVYTVEISWGDQREYHKVILRK